MSALSERKKVEVIFEQCSNVEVIDLEEDSDEVTEIQLIESAGQKPSLPYIKLDPIAMSKNGRMGTKYILFGAQHLVCSR